jgi:hypothetical protein
LAAFYDGKHAGWLHVVPASKQPSAAGIRSTPHFMRRHRTKTTRATNGQRKGQWGQTGLHSTYELGLGIRVRFLELVELVLVDGLVGLLGAHELLLGLRSLGRGGGGSCGGVYHGVAVEVHSSEGRSAGGDEGG